MSGTLREMRERGERRRRDEQPTPHPWPDDAEPTDTQVAEWLAVCTPAERLECVRRWRQHADRGWLCLLENHERRLSLHDVTRGPGRHRADEDSSRP